MTKGRALLDRTAGGGRPHTIVSPHGGILVIYSQFMRAILAGGGTGGHVIPALAIAQELQKQYSAEILFIGTARGIENRMVPAAGFTLRLVQVGALKNVSLATRLKTALDLPRAVWDSHRI